MPDDDKPTPDHTVPKGVVQSPSGAPLPGAPPSPFTPAPTQPGQPGQVQTGGGNEEEEEKLPLVMSVLVNTAQATPDLDKHAFVLKLTRGDEVEAWKVIKTFLDSPEELDESAVNEDDLISFLEYFKSASSNALTNYDVKRTFDLKAGTGPMIRGTKPLWERKFCVPEYYTPFLKVFLNDLGEDLERQQDTLGSKGIILRGAEIEFGVLNIRFKIVSGPDQERLSNKYEGCYAAMDRVMSKLLPNYGIAKSIT